MFVPANTARLQVVEVNLGEISLKGWIPRPVSGADSEDDLFVYGKTATVPDDLQKQVVIVEQILKNCGYTPFLLAGDIDIMRTVGQRLAGQQSIPVEFADSTALRHLGGVGGLLHKSVKEYVQPYPLANSTLDLVA